MPGIFFVFGAAARKTKGDAGEYTKAAGDLITGGSGVREHTRINNLRRERIYVIVIYLIVIHVVIHVVIAVVSIAIIVACFILHPIEQRR